MNMPDYLILFDGNSRLRDTHLDSLSYEVNISYGTTSISNLNKSFFFRSHSIWNSLPFDIRNTPNPDEFNTKITEYFWKLMLTDIEEYEESDMSTLDNSQYSD